MARALILIESNLSTGSMGTVGPSPAGDLFSALGKDDGLSTLQLTWNATLSRGIF